MVELSKQDIYNRIYPSAMRLTPETTDDEYKCLRDHLSELEDVIEIMETEIIFSCSPQEKSKRIKEYYKNLLEVSDKLLADEYPLLATAALDIASLAVTKGGDIQHATDIFVEFEEQLRNALDSLDTRAATVGDANENLVTVDIDEEETQEPPNDWLSFFIDTVSLVFVVAARIPSTTQGASFFHEKAIELLSELSDVDVEAYQNAVIEHFHVCLNERTRFPSALKIVSESYEYIVANSLDDLAEMVEEEEPEQTKKALIRCIDILGLSAILVVYAENLPNLQKAALTAFEEYYGFLEEESNPDYASAVVHGMLTESYKLTGMQDFPKGLQQLTALIKKVTGPVNQNCIPLSPQVAPNGDAARANLIKAMWVNLKNSPESLPLARMH